ncbi:MAG TPA: class I SAM-dependent methyltransferase [Anaeromyxobacter sp.]|nr:class I SAM-dependent methyltransferase [Anaeromyxobacter sp.]
MSEHGHGGRRHGRDGGGHGREHGHGGHGRDRHGNPQDLDAYLARLEDPERAGWQKPDEVVRALGLREGAVACDVGAGPGVFALRLARAVGPRGRVHAIDVEPRILEILRARAREAGVSNVHPLLAASGDAALPPEPCEAILVVNTFHHFPDGAAALRRLAGALAPGGVIANVDFHEGELPVGPPPDHKVSRAAFLAAAAAAGLEVAREETFLPYQYFVLLRPRPIRRARRPRGARAARG